MVQGTGTKNVGTSNPRAVLNESQVRHIRQLSEDGFTMVEIAKIYEGIASYGAVYGIVKRQTWRHL